MRSGRGGLEPTIPRPQRGGRPRKTDMQAAVNPILYLLRTDRPWRYLPRDHFPLRSTVYNIFRKFHRDGIRELPVSRQDFENLAEALATLVTPCLHPACPQAAPKE